MPKISSVVMGLGVPAMAAAFFGNEVIDQRTTFKDRSYKEQIVLSNCEQTLTINDTNYKIGEILANQAPLIIVAENDKYTKIELNGRHVTFPKDCKADQLEQKIAEALSFIRSVSFQR